MRFRLLLLLLLLLATRYTAAASAISNDRVTIDMTQNNPGDSVGWQQTRFADPRELSALGYSGQTSTARVQAATRCSAAFR